MYIEKIFAVILFKHFIPMVCEQGLAKIITGKCIFLPTPQQFKDQEDKNTKDYCVC